MESKNFPKAIGSTVLSGGSAVVITSAAMPALQSLSALIFEGGEMTTVEKTRQLNIKFKNSMKTPKAPTINAIIGMFYLKVMLGGIVNT